ncbi:MAG TPA: MmoB/DmpM family protein [Paracoccaceae bacterium]|nr:MmoB/DmpM family protein [Paracoccaceae bacterium]
MADRRPLGPVRRCAPHQQWLFGAPDGPAGPRERPAEKGFSNLCGITLSDSEEGNVNAKLVQAQPGVTITRWPSIIRIDGVGRLEFDLRQIGEELGRAFDSYAFQVEMSTHYGRMVIIDDEEKVILFADPAEAQSYLVEGGWLEESAPAAAPPA